MHNIDNISHQIEKSKRLCYTFTIMLIIGERINATRKPIGLAIEKKDGDFIQREAEKQVAAGANYLDLNAGLHSEREKDDLLWLIENVQKVTEVPLCLDSANPIALQEGLKNCKKRPMINSINGEEKKIEAFLPILKNYQGEIIALTMDDKGIPETVEQRLRITEKLVKILNEKGIKNEQIYIDPLVQPLSVNQKFGLQFLGAVRQIKATFHKIKTTCGLSNISFGLPQRKTINQAFIILAIEAALDSAILDPLDKKLISSVYTSEALLGKDEYCLKYIKAFREGRIGRRGSGLNT